MEESERKECGKEDREREVGKRENRGREELITLCEEADIVRMTPAGDALRIDVSAWSAVICEIMLLGLRKENRTHSDSVESYGTDISAILTGSFFAEMISLEMFKEGYRLKFYNMDVEIEQEIVFENISMRCEPCNALCERIEGYTRLQTPWEYLGMVARGICCHIDYGVANEEERKVRRLAEFLEVLQGSWESVKVWKDSPAPEKVPEDSPAPEVLSGIPHMFWECAKEYGISSVVEQYASDYGKLFRELSKGKYEPFWRRIYRLLAATQDGIPSHAERCCTDADLQAHRKLVTRHIKEQGFEGEYPYFYYESPTRKVCCAKSSSRQAQNDLLCMPTAGNFHVCSMRPCLFFSYENMHIAFRKETTKSFIFCREQDADGAIETELFCGIKFRAEEEDDVFSCMFDNDGKSCFSCFTTIGRTAAANHGTDTGAKGKRTDAGAEGQSTDAGAEGQSTDVGAEGTCVNGTTMEAAEKLKTACIAAGKSANLRHLNRKEYRYKHTAAVWNSRGFYIVFFFVSLVMFGALMTVGFMALEAALVFLFTQSAADVAECFCSTPWEFVFWAAGILFALFMTAGTFFAMRK